ncbi:MAG: hypothetical protein Q9186_005538 [Xanthomendoza sp. 1 TL-2023]
MHRTWLLGLVFGLVTHGSAVSKPACKDAKSILPNGDFETGSLAPWLVLFSAPNLLDAGPKFSYNVTSPGYKSHYAFTVTDKSAAPFVEVDIGQIDVPVCAGRRYKLSAQVFIKGPAMSDQLLQLYADQKLVAEASKGYVKGNPNKWRQLKGTFTASAASVPVQVTMRTTKIVDGEWGVDDVVIVPA